MTTPHQLSRQDARRVAVRAQLLDADRPGDLFEVVRHLGLVQNDPTAAVAPSADLVLWCRLGQGYDAAELRDAIDTQALLELDGMIRPPEDLALYRAEMAAWPGSGRLKEWQHDIAAWVHDNDACRLDILELLRSDGPLPLRALPDTTVRPWRSSGWTNNRNVEKLLGFMVQRGEVAASGREGRERLWDLAERIYPDDPAPDEDEARRLRDCKRLRALGVARGRAPAAPAEPNDVGEAGEPAVVEGVKGTWRVDPTYLDGLGSPDGFIGRAALLSPLDRLVYDRRRMEELFEFDYQLEMYKPVSKRRWGYWAMPILHGDQLVGKLDATSDRKGGVLVVDAVHEDGPWTKRMRADVRREIEDLARWLDLELVEAG
ncbi:DNA glycosylase AlkZ-like family protein [Nocardioides iriomotensis]|uniref:Winged helix-turn-helix domain-containing protein n=1 Tax=Nocardioides iriomotensis TaxID=715784 RepID=A0A4Q5J3F8_9ACTN|nr:crosslink repair DNA glycosylase YcaQ family protein [Nocardioides iriomotensis]RYU11991.1 winged helix-turn-helix domain-containing protein [Nocardioides iriomotensis]